MLNKLRKFFKWLFAKPAGIEPPTPQPNPLKRIPEAKTPYILYQHGSDICTRIKPKLNEIRKLNEQRSKKTRGHDRHTHYENQLYDSRKFPEEDN